jgi:hypothetical protein
VIFGHQRAELLHIRRVNPFHEGEHNVDWGSAHNKMAFLPPEV